MGLSRSSRQYMGVRAITPPDLVFAERAPTSADTAHVIGDIWLDKTALASYQFLGTNWIELGTGVVGDIATLTGDTGGPISPVGANIDILGDVTSGIHVDGTAGTLTITADASNETQRGTIRLATPAESVAGLIAGVAVAPNTLTNRLQSPGPIGGTLPDAAFFTNINSFTLDTTGDITTASGDIFISGTGKKLVVQGGLADDFIGQATLAAGTVTVLNTQISAADKIFPSRQGINGSTALGVFDYSISPGVSFTIVSRDPADASTETNDISIVDYFIVREQ